MTVTVTIPDANSQQVINAICYTKGYTGWLVPPSPENPEGTPESKGAFCKRQFIIWVQDQLTIAGYSQSIPVAQEEVRNEVAAIPITVE
jgi:hypothetical protein